MRCNFVLCLALSIIAGLASPSAALAQTQPQVVYSQFDPIVIRSDGTQPVLFEARVVGNPSRVVLEFTTVVQQAGVDLEMRDDGSGGDRAAGDSVYTVMVQASQITQGLQADDVFRRFIGFLKVFQSTNLVFRGNVIAEIITDQIARLPITSLATDAQRTTHVVNLVDSDFVTGVNSDVTRITKRFYQLFGDDYDFLNIVYISTRFQNRHHRLVKNQIQGIGVTVFNNTANYGSSGKLSGISVFPISSLFDGADLSYQHELGHQWINFLQIPSLESGVPHWPISSLASGIMGFSLPPNSQGGEYPCLLTSEPGGIRLTPRNGPPVFTDLDLYLMGLLPASQVGDHIVFTDQNLARTLPCNNQLFTGEVTRIRITDIVDALGPRVPDSTNAPKNFKVATILVSKNRLLSEDEMAFFNFFSRRAEETREVAVHVGLVKGTTTKPFVVSTRALGTLNTQINAPTLLLEEGTTRALALDSVTLTRAPFSIFSSHNFSADGRTRIMLFAAGVELQPGETAAIVTAQAEDSQQRTFPLSVEYVGKLAGVNWLTQINLRMPDEVSTLEDIRVSIRVRGVPSNKVLIN
ncbi:MAG TPA: choice-of-anchor X domain-containing protein [Pyrinomonadaceae bacterium]|nr:choice-of-anchor X domain-containing protein [Pyrinomonadaceae bacterium]